MWETPIYKFNAIEKGQSIPILIDVTGSAPNFSEPGRQLEYAFGSLLAGLNSKNTTILDFGAAKLRNTLHLLKDGYTVYACDYEDLFKRSTQAAEYLEKANKFGNFKSLIFPKDFITAQKEFDVILCINVLNIMPVPVERHAVLKIFREKIKDDGRLLWYTQHGAYSSDRNSVRVSDGIATGKGRNYKMFYRDFSRKDIHDMLNAYGFTFDNTFKFSKSGNNQAYVFRPSGPILVENSLDIHKQLKHKEVLQKITRKSATREEYETKVPTRTTKPKPIDITNQYLKELKNILPGKAKKQASRYHNLIFTILKDVFYETLSSPEKEDCWDEKIQRVDITFKNYRKNGFFKQLDEGYKIVCPNIFIECKNYNKDIANEEFSQIHNRLNNRRGQFGIIVCRSIVDVQKVKQRQLVLAKDSKFVIVLTDADIEKILNAKITNDNGQVDDLLEKKFKELI
ncbi:MAG: class I SAM-dependent methyltransferase [Candidatus Omnitrophota bacterium]